MQIWICPVIDKIDRGLDQDLDKGQNLDKDQDLGQDKVQDLDQNLGITNLEDLTLLLQVKPKVLYLYLLTNSV